jgi:hypothetical protein
VILQGCDTAPSTSPDSVVVSGALQISVGALPFPAAGEFVATVTNPYFPLNRGTIYEYRADTKEGSEVTTVTVTGDTKSILGINATVVHDEVRLNGVLIEDTYDWFAQDKTGNVWYLGEKSCEIEANQCVSTAGSWEAGQNGAEAGIIMWANPSAHVGEVYRQEFLAGEAEDMAKVVRLNATAAVPFQSLSGCVETREWSAIQPGGREHKFYCPGVGRVLETGSGIRNELVSILIVD